MPDYAIMIEDDGSGNFNVQAFRNPATLPVSAAAAGGVLSIPHNDNNNAAPVTFAVTGATNATPIVLTLPSGHTVAAGDSVQVTGVGGNLAANGTFIVSAASATTATLRGSAGSGAYTSGGRVRVLPKSTQLAGMIEVAKRAILDDRSANP